MVRASFVVLLATVLACGEEPVGVQVAGSCVAGLLFDGRLYVSHSEPPASFTAGAVVGKVSRNVGCNDTPQFGVVPAPGMVSDGDSNFLPVGTLLHAVEGFDPSEKIAAEVDTFWLTLTPVAK